MLNRVELVAEQKRLIQVVNLICSQMEHTCDYYPQQRKGQFLDDNMQVVPPIRLYLQACHTSCITNQALRLGLSHVFPKYLVMTGRTNHIVLDVKIYWKYLYLGKCVEHVCWLDNCIHLVIVVDIDECSSSQNICSSKATCRSFDQYIHPLIL